jgi:hypothetical protein
MRRPAILALLALSACSRNAPSSAQAPGTASVAPVASVAPSSAPSGAASSATADAGDPLEAEAKREWEKNPRVDIVYVPTPQAVVDKMLEVAKVQKGDVVYDLGCGDGRIVVGAAKRGAMAMGFDIDPTRVTEARGRVKAAGLEPSASIKWANVFSVDLKPANVVMLYLLPELNVKLIPQLEKLRPGSRIVSHDFDMKGVTPDSVVTIQSPEFVNGEGYSAYKGEGVPEDAKNYKLRAHTIYLWTVPLKKTAQKP